MSEVVSINTQEKFEVKKIQQKEKIKKIIKIILIYGFLTVLALYILFPLYWMFNSAFKTYKEFISVPPTFLPLKPTFDNFKEALTNENTPLLRFIGNTILVGAISTALTLITTILSAFAFARLKFKGSSILFALLLSTMMIPGEMYVITNYVTVTNMGLYDTYAALIVPFIISIFYIFLLRQTFKQIPNELYLAAKVDGKSDWQYLWRVMVPIAKPTLITVTILKMLGTWNAYVWPNLVTHGNSDKKLISQGLRELATNVGMGDLIPHHEITMAASLIVSLPILIVFIVLRKYIMRGVGRSGTKG